MIISTGLRTDIINHYSEWLFERFREGYVLARNPLFPNKVTRYLLSPDTVDAVTFCSKNYTPALHRLHEITERFRSYFHVTVTAYGKDFEPNIPMEEDRITMLCALSRLVGKERVVWRFSPVFFTEDYPMERVTDTFQRLADRIAPYVHLCVFSFLEPFFSMRTRCPQIQPLTNEQKVAFARTIAKTARHYDLPLQTCGSLNTYTELGIVSAGCYTLDAIGKANHCTFRSMRHDGNKRGCLCIQSRDLGWYNSCPNLCFYCNANASVGETKKNIRMHDPHSPLLIGTILPEDEISDASQQSYLRDERQISLFDL